MHQCHGVQGYIPTGYENPQEMGVKLDLVRCPAETKAKPLCMEFSTELSASR